MKGFVIAGTKSGSGKTTLSLAFMAYYKRLRMKVAPFKVGPDFIDPGHHKSITGQYSRNLDAFMLSKDYNIECFKKHATSCDIAIVEGVMGLFDGYDGCSELGSTAQMAKWLKLPIILIVDAKSMARSVAALIYGFENFDKSLKFAGVIFNNIGSKRHLDYLKEATEKNINMPCLGGVLRDDKIKMPERHLGLVTHNEYLLNNNDINRLADLIEHNIDVKKIEKSLKNNDFILPFSEISLNNKKRKSVKIGVAWDKAFCFYYKDNLEMLEVQGAELVFFSPLDDKALPDFLDGIYFGGGYPELFADKLSNNMFMLHSVKKKALEGMPIYGECGGFMYLCDKIIAKDNVEYQMTGCFPFQIIMLNKLKSLGYREVRLNENSIIGKTGDLIKGHEFHYSELKKNNNSIDTIYSILPIKKIDLIFEGYVLNKTLGSYVHLHFGSNPNIVFNYIDSCKKYKFERAIDV